MSDYDGATAIDPGTQIGADGHRYPTGTQPTDPAPWRSEDVLILGPALTGQVPVKQSDGSWRAGDVEASLGVLEADLNFGGFKGINVGAPVADTDAATKGYVLQVRDALINGAPGQLDTVNEIAAALGNDANLAATLTASIATKLAIGATAGGDLTGTYPNPTLDLTKPHSWTGAITIDATAPGLLVKKTGGSPGIFVDCDAGQIGDIRFTRANVRRWMLRMGNETESGSGAGSLLYLYPSTDAGGLGTAYWQIDRNNNGALNRAPIVGKALTIVERSAGQVLLALLANSADPFQVRDSTDTNTLAKIDNTGLGTFAGLSITDAKNIALATGTGTKIGTATSQKLGFWNATPVTQPTRAGALTDNSGGTGGGSTIAAIGGAVDPTAALKVDTANAIATLAARLNLIEAKLSASAGGCGITA